MAEKFNLDAFKAFVASKPADERYEATDSKTCALAQFGYVNLGRVEARLAGVPDDVYAAIFRPLAERHRPNTFGALSHRLGKVNQSRRGI